MLKRLITLMAAAMLLAFAVSACGDDGGDSSNGNGGADKAAEAQSGDSTADETGSTDVTDATVESGDVEVPANLEEAVEQCKRNIANSPQISDDAKSKLEGICDKAGSGDAEEIQDAAREVCETIVEDSIPDGSPGREAALSACDNASGQ